MSENQKLTKHIGEQKPVNQSPKPSDNGGNSTDNSNSNSNSGNPIKPQETQKGACPVKNK